MTIKEEFDALMKEIETTNFSPTETGYLVSAKFINEFRESAKFNIPPGPIDNNDIKRKGKLQPNKKQNVDYFVITKDTWEKLLFDYTGGPEITCTFDSLGNANIYPIKITLNYKKESVTAVETRVLPYETLLAEIRARFDIPENYQINIFQSGGKTPIAFTPGGTIEPLVTYANKPFEITAEPPKLPKESKNSQGSKSSQNQKTSNDKNQILKIVGLKNLGNTCYMNSSIQCFLCLPHFTSKIDSFTSGDISLSFQTLYRNILKSKSAYDPKLFKQAFGKRIPIFSGTSQQDAHEFTSFFIDIMQEENPKIITPLFYGESESTTLCAICGKPKQIVEKFSSLSLPISSSRRIIYSPWDLSEPMLRLSSVPTSNSLVSTKSPIILYGSTRTGQRIAQAFTSEFTEMLALEIPERFDEEQGEGLAITKLYCEGKLICKPILVRVPLDKEMTSYDLEISVCNRIDGLFDQNVWKKVRHSIKFRNTPITFTKYDPNRQPSSNIDITQILKESDKNKSSSNTNSKESNSSNDTKSKETGTTNSSSTPSTESHQPKEVKYIGNSGIQYACNEEIIVDIMPPYGYKQYGFLENRTRAYSSTISLNELLEAYFSEIQLDTQNKWRCENCGDESCAFHNVKLMKTPENLVIQLKRFASGNKFERDNSPVSIPYQIDLSHYFKEQQKAIYSLKAISNHIGNLDSGHYTALGKRCNTWYLFNDSKVAEKESLPKEPSDAPYLLFFSKEL